MRLLDAELLHAREILPDQWLQGYRAPWLASGATAGQFVHVRTPDWSGLVLRRPFSINTLDRTSGEVTIHFRITGKGTEALARMRPGDSVGMLGPLGRGFEAVVEPDEVERRPDPRHAGDNVKPAHQHAQELEVVRVHGGDASDAISPRVRGNADSGG